jgi:hypothetical protein
MNALAIDQESLRFPPMISGTVTQHSCRFCSAPLESYANPLFEVATQRIVPACDKCASLFLRNDGRPFKLIPRQTRALENFQMPDVSGEAFSLAVGVTFIFYSTGAARLLAVYRSAFTTVETIVPRETWKAMVEANPALEEMRPDVEGLLIISTLNFREYCIAPIDVCYNLVKPDALPAKLQAEALVTV